MKTEKNMKSFTQTFLYLLRFYQDNYETIKELEEQEKDVGERLDILQSHVQNLEDNMVTTSQFDQLQTTIEVLANSQEMIQPLMDRVSDLQDKAVTSSELGMIEKQVNLLTNIVENLVESRIDEGDAALKENQSIKALYKARQKLDDQD